jgi:hypothetical protein
MLRVGGTDQFEREYTHKLTALLAPQGQLLAYESDRAALDLGLHLYARVTSVESLLSQVRVWFQIKGIRASTLSLDEIAESETIPVSDLRVDHLLYWFAHPEPVYLVLYVEALDAFFAEDVRRLVEQRGGLPWLKAIEQTQKTTTVRLPVTATLDQALQAMPRHRTLRLDGPDFRGRPLGHRFDPLRSELSPLQPDHFVALIARLLEAHEFRQTREIDLAATLDRPIGQLTAAVGRLYLTYEWISPLFTEFGYSPGTDFRIEAPPNFAHGDVLIVIHSEPTGHPSRNEEIAELVRELRQEGVRQALVFFNAPESDADLFGSWRHTLEPLGEIPQGLGSLAFNVLTATSVYIEFLDRLQLGLANYR